MENIWKDGTTTSRLKIACIFNHTCSPFFPRCMSAYSLSLLPCPVVSNLCDLMDCSPPGSSVHGIFEARILGWIAVSYSRGSSRSRDQPMSLANPALAGRFFTTIPPRKLIFLILYTYMLFLLNYLQVCFQFWNLTAKYFMQCPRVWHSSV